MKSVVIATGVLVKIKNLGSHAMSVGKAIATSAEWSKAVSRCAPTMETVRESVRSIALLLK